VQDAFGPYDLDGVSTRVSRPATDRLGARAFTVGNTMVFREANPDLETVAHEAAHVLQQRSGAHPDEVGHHDDKYERQAEAVARRVTRARSAASALDSFADKSADADDAPRARTAPLQCMRQVGFEFETQWVVVARTENTSSKQLQGFHHAKNSDELIHAVRNELQPEANINRNLTLATVRLDQHDVHLMADSFSRCPPLEFVTDPLPPNPDRVGKEIAALQSLAASMESMASEGLIPLTSVIEGRTGTRPDDFIKTPVIVPSRSGELVGKPQASLGVKARGIPSALTIAATIHNDLASYRSAGRPPGTALTYALPQQTQSVGALSSVLAFVWEMLNRSTAIAADPKWTHDHQIPKALLEPLLPRVPVYRILEQVPEVDFRRLYQIARQRSQHQSADATVTSHAPVQEANAGSSHKPFYLENPLQLVTDLFRMLGMDETEAQKWLVGIRKSDHQPISLFETVSWLISPGAKIHGANTFDTGEIDDQTGEELPIVELRDFGGYYHHTNWADVATHVTTLSNIIHDSTSQHGS
jgi:hypothetical protein